MNITHIIFSLQTGGAENMLIDIVNEQSLRSHNITIIIINKNINQDLTSLICNNIEIIEIDRPQSSKNPYYFIRLYYLLHKIHPDIIHCHNIELGKILQYIPIKKIITVHTTDDFSTSLKYFDIVVSISNAVYNSLLSAGYDSLIVHNGIKLNNIDKKSRAYTDIIFRIIQVGSLRHDIKGQDISLQALSYLKRKYPSININLTFIGEGTSQEYLKKMAGELKVSDNVEFLGLKSKTYIYKHLKKFDLLIQPSRYEGFGISIIEAMAAKIPVLVSDIEGPMEVIKNGDLGVYFHSEDYVDLGNKIISILEGDNNKVEYAYDYALKNYSIEKTVLRYIEIYKDVIGGIK